MDNHQDQQDLPKAKPAFVPPTAASLVTRALSQPSTESKPESQPAKLKSKLLDEFWLKMTEMYGHRWISNYGVEVDHDSVWGRVLAGLSGVQLATGLYALMDRGEEFKWPPPANVFRAMCLEVRGLPTEDDAWFQALRGVYGHEAVRIAAKATGTFDLQQAELNDKGLREVFSRNYAIVKARAAMGKPLDEEIPKAIAHEEKTPMQKQMAHSHREARDLIQAQGLPTDPKQARELLLAKMGIRREGNAHV